MRDIRLKYVDDVIPMSFGSALSIKKSHRHMLVGFFMLAPSQLLQNVVFCAIRFVPREQLKTIHFV